MPLSPWPPSASVERPPPPPPPPPPPHSVVSHDALCKQGGGKFYARVAKAAPVSASVHSTPPVHLGLDPRSVRPASSASPVGFCLVQPDQPVQPVQPVNLVPVTATIPPQIETYAHHRQPAPCLELDPWDIGMAMEEAAGRKSVYVFVVDIFRKNRSLGLQVKACEDSSGLLVANLSEEHTDIGEWNNSCKESFPMKCVQVGDVILSANLVRPLANEAIAPRPRCQAMIDELLRTDHVMMILCRDDQDFLVGT